MNRDYLNDSLDAYARSHNGRSHPMASKTLNLVWLQVRDIEEFNKIGHQIERAPFLQAPPLKCETLSSGITTALRRLSRHDIRHALAALAGDFGHHDSGARQRHQHQRSRAPMELAVLKVLGFCPRRFFLVLGEAALIGGAGGLVSVAITYFLVNNVLNTYVPNPIFVPGIMLPWGGFLGAGAAILGSAFPAWSACRVRVSEVFARIG